MDVFAPLVESFERQAGMVDALAGLVTEANRRVRTDPEGWRLDEHLAHIHAVRYGWLENVSPEDAKSLASAHRLDGDDWVVIDSLDEIRSCLKQSAQAVVQVFGRLVGSGVGRVGSYDHPVFFLQHMLWHDGYHYGLANLCLRLAGDEPSEEWEERHVWGVWRDPEI